VITASPDAPPATPRWLDPVGAVALFLGGAALLCASAHPLGRFVVPLSLVSLLAGLVGLVLASTSGKTRLLLPGAGTAVGGIVLFIALLFPALLGPIYRASRDRNPIDPAAIRPVPLPGRTPASVPDDAGWADASRVVLHQGRVRLQVTKVSVGPLETPSTSKKKGKPEEYLVIHLRTHRVEDPGELAANRGKRPELHKEAPRPILKDESGKVYATKEVLAMDAAEEVRKSSLFPVTMANELFVFEPPAAGLTSLRLEVPAAAWGGPGVFRFAIPSTMIQREPVGRHRVGAAPTSR
jgi:hypothetical protein